MTRDLHAGGEVLGLYWTVFGTGAIAGSLVAGSLRRLPLWPTTLAIVLGWGVSLLPFWADAPTALTITAFGFGGTIYGPFVALSISTSCGQPPRRACVEIPATTSALAPRCATGHAGDEPRALLSKVLAIPVPMVPRTRRVPTG